MVQQEVHISRKEANSIEFTNSEIFIPIHPGEEQTFEISIINHGTPTHVHFSPSTNLRDKIVFLRDNPYVQKEAKIPAVVHIPQTGEKLHQGEIYVTTGYGSKKESFKAMLGVEIKEEKTPIVVVDESLSRYDSKAIEKPKATIAKEKPALKLPSFELPTPREMPRIVVLIIGLLIVAFVLIFLSSINPPVIDRFYGSIAASAIIVYLLIYVVEKVK